MAAEIESKLGLSSELVGGGGGVFDVFANGELVFSKHAEGDEFPDHGDVIQRLSKLQ